MRDKVLDTIEKYEMIGQGDHVCAAVSGGADSAALLAFLLSLREPMGLTVTACHLNHCLRGAEADRDEAFVRELCQRWQVPLTVERVEVAELARQEHLSEETAGRKARYALFERLHRETGCKVATAHTLSDNMETVLFSMARGTGLRGMCGIQPVRDYLIRPLIAVTRQEVEAYCAENGIGFVTDSTNFSEEYTRNRIRLRLIPELYALNPALPEAFAHLIEAMGEGYELVSREAEQFLGTAESYRGHTAYTAEAFLALPAAVRREVLSRMAVAEGGTLSHRQTGICTRLAAEGGASEIGGGVRFCSREGRIWMERPAQPAEGFCFPVSPEAGEQRFFLPDGRKVCLIPLNCEFLEKNVKEQYNALKNVLDCGRIYGNIVLRSRNSGDRIRPAGRGVTKTLKKLLSEAGIPPERRDSLALLSDDRGLLWAEGFGCDERAAAVCPLQGDQYWMVCIEGKDYE